MRRSFVTMISNLRAHLTIALTSTAADCEMEWLSRVPQNYADKQAFGSPDWTGTMHVFEDGQYMESCY